MNLTLATAGAGAPGERMDTESMRAEALGLALPGDISFWNAVAAAADLVDSRALIIDTETTGLGVDDEVIEIAVCDMDGQPVYHSLVRPSCPVSPDARAANGITDAELAAAPPWSDVQPGFLAAIAGRRGLAAYNAPFDRRLIMQTARRDDLRRLDDIQCVMKLFAGYAGDLAPDGTFFKRTSLLNAARHFGWSAPQRHRAIDDCEMAAFVLRSIAALRPPPAAPII